MAANALKSTTLLLKDTGWRVHGKWGTKCTTVNTSPWPWMCSPGRQWQGTFDCPLPWCTSMALGCCVLTVGRGSTMVAHYRTTRPRSLCVVTRRQKSQISGPIPGTRGWGTAVGYSRLCIVHWWGKWLRRLLVALLELNHAIRWTSFSTKLINQTIPL